MGIKINDQNFIDILNMIQQILKRNQSELINGECEKFEVVIDTRLKNINFNC